MTKWFLVFLAQLVGITGCSDHPANGTSVEIYNDRLGSQYLNYDTAWREKRSDIMFENGEGADDCASYVALFKKSKLKEGVNNQLIRSEYLVCEALYLIGDGHSVMHERSNTSGATLASGLDIGSFSSSLFQMTDDDKRTLEQMVPGQLSSEGNHVVYQLADWVYRLEVVAAGDIDGNGKTDWLIWLSDESKTGNYRSYQTLISYDIPSSGLLTAQTFEGVFEAP